MYICVQTRITSENWVFIKGISVFKTKTKIFITRLAFQDDKDHCNETCFPDEEIFMVRLAF